MKYSKEEVIKLLDAKTISVLLTIYGISYKHLAARFNISKPAISYHMKNDSFKAHERAMLLEIFVSQGLEILELILINKMMNTSLHRRER
ncbi:hypothetical protein [Peribacillus sp. SCS-37]|uniref:hypothetical protein n=1 Tax=Paraperibacillus esterisolvens TaxID=3115296 RepID=UPI00390649AD